jgi:hypothetical protein
LLYSYYEEGLTAEQSAERYLLEGRENATPEDLIAEFNEMVRPLKKLHLGKPPEGD